MVVICLFLIIKSFLLIISVYFQDVGNMRNSLTNIQKRYTMNKDDSDVDINKDINVDMGFTVGQVSLNRGMELSWKLLQKLTFDVITD